jgi:hemoglobin
MTHFEQVGGEPALRRILEDFYDRVFSDLMIGYLFKGRDKARLVTLELQLTARVMGADVVYEGRPMRAAHAALSINRGQFQRRNQLLRETLRDHEVPDEVQRAWVAHATALERAILGGRADPDCMPYRGPDSDP